MGAPGTPRAAPAGLRVAFYSDAGELGGAEQSLATLLAELSPRIEATVLGTDAAVVDWLATHRRGTRARLLPAVAGKRDLRAILAHVAALARLRPRVLHANLRTPWSCQYGILAGELVPGTRVIAVEQLPMPSSDERQRRTKRLLSSRLAAHVAVGARSARAIEELSGAPAGSVRTIYNGVPDVRLDPLPRPGPGLVVGTLARLDAQKGLDVLLRALTWLPGVTAVLVGEGRERGRLTGLAAELELSHRVHFTGWSPEARRHLSTFDIFVLPSLYEGFPLAIVEAMLAGVPVVATDVGSVAEAVGDGRTGLLVPPGDDAALAAALRRLVDDPELRRALGERGRALARERFSSSAMTRAFEELYDEVAP